MLRRTVVVVTSRHRKVRHPYATRTQCIVLDMLMVKIICHSIAADTLGKYETIIGKYETRDLEL